MDEFNRIVNRAALKIKTSWGLTVTFVLIALLRVRGAIVSGKMEGVGYAIGMLTLAFTVRPASPSRANPLPAKALILVIAGIFL